MDWRDAIIDVNLDNIKKKVARMSYEKFEHHVADILQSDGYRLITLTDYSGNFGPGDFGADVIVEKGGIKTAVQAKYTRSKKFSLTPAIQEVVTSRAFYKCHNSMVVTNGPAPKRKIKLAELNNCRIIAGDEFWRIAEKYELEYSHIFQSTVSKRLIRKAKKQWR